MSMTPTMTAVLIGGDTLLVACGDLLIARGVHIAAVMSRARVVKDWCARNEFLLLEPTRAAAQDLERVEFDHLFSIAHLAVVPDEILRLARGEKINFHDAPLPYLAGVNTPNWAILRGEKEHGVTWHRMTSTVDEGEILATERFAIDADETALSLNTKCFEAGLRSFGAVIDGLVAKTLSPRAQDFTHRTYYSRADRPVQVCVVDWRQPARKIEALVRALDYGRYKNPFGAAKVCAGHDVWIVKRLHLGSDSCRESPGSVLDTEHGALAVATSAGVVCLDEVSDSCGTVVSLADVRARVMASGGRFESLSEDIAQRATARNADLGRSEDFWIERLGSLSSIELPFLDAPTGKPVDLQEVALPSQAALRARFAGRSPRAVSTACIGAWLARLAGRAAFDLAHGDARLRARVDRLERWISPRVPVKVHVDVETSFTSLVSAVEAELELVEKRGSFLHDVVARNPNLAADAHLASGFVLPTAIEHVEGPEDALKCAPQSASFVVAADGSCKLVHDRSRLAPEAAQRLCDSLAAFTAHLARDPAVALKRASLVGAGERERLTRGFDATDRAIAEESSVHAVVEGRARRTPDAPAVTSGEMTCSYREVDERSNRLAAHLVANGVGPGAFVGVCLERSVDLVVAVLAVLKSGAAYLPLDPAFPEERTRFMLADSGARIAIAQASTLDRVSAGCAHVVCVDVDAAAIATRSSARVDAGTKPTDLAYVIYTSGSTGKPKGVMVEHRNVLNFLIGMDERIPHDPPGAWLAVTSLSFDISVLELVWTLARGFHTIVHQGRVTARATLPRGAPDFSLFYFSSDETKPGLEKYRLLLEGAKFADENWFAAVWTPERHFHSFGGVYPAPAVAGAAVAAITKRVGIRAGSIVLPINHPIRVVEGWSVVDNLSNGRVGLSFASGWQPNDFVLAPDNFARAKQVMFESLDIVRKLWRGESVEFPGPKGEPISIQTLPRPVQAELPTWITTAGNPETYAQAGRAGANLLTHLLGQSIEELTPKIELYRRARAEAGFDPETGVVTLMLHTFVADADADVDVRGIVRGPLRHYLGTSLDLLKKYAWAFPAFKKPASADASSGDEFAGLSEEERDAVLEHAFERYFETSGLFGTPEQCLELVERLRGIGVGEIACLIDFGVPTEQALAALPALKRLERLASKAPAHVQPSAGDHGASIADDIRRHQVTHMQCTPSMARMLCLDPEARAALWTVHNLMIGGEAFPASLSTELASFPHAITNMYGPTETTIWSSTHTIEKGATTIPIGTAIANTRFYVLDPHRELVPVGVPGELWIAGEGVARGYHGREELTQERFAVDPFSGDGRARMYRTGDLGRRRADGVLEFLGRLDHQVKIRGYRIELGEIEVQLAAHSAVREAVVAASTDAHGEARLVAYIVANGKAPTTDDLRDYLRAKLPEYMVPGWFVVLDRFPLTPNGKVDRNSLPAPEVGQLPSSRKEFIAPSIGVESRLAALWSEILGLEKVGIDDNFFDVGGHSLLVVRMHRQIGAIVDKPVSLTDLYRFPTIRSFADWIASDGVNKVLDVGAERGAKRRDALLRRRRD